LKLSVDAVDVIRRQAAFNVNVIALTSQRVEGRFDGYIISQVIPVGHFEWLFVPAVAFAP
jgi:hypothetical protein